MARRKNVKRIDPRYFLHETVNRDINTGEALEEERQAPVTHWIAGPGGLVDQHGDVFVKHGTPFAAQRSPTQPGMMKIGVRIGTGTEQWFSERPVPYEDVQKHSSNSNYNPPRPGPEHRPRSGWNETVNRNDDGSALEEWVDGGASDMYAGDYAQSPGEKRREAARRHEADKAARKKAEADAREKEIADWRASLKEEELEETGSQDTGFGEEDIEVNRAAVAARDSGEETPSLGSKEGRSAILASVGKLLAAEVGDWILPSEDDPSFNKISVHQSPQGFLEDLKEFSLTYALDEAGWEKIVQQLKLEM